jgi:hypothetical protein
MELMEFIESQEDMPEEFQEIVSEELFNLI